VRIFACPHCGHIVYFDSPTCLECGADLAYARHLREMVMLGDDGRFRDDTGTWRRCRNENWGCNWLAPEALERAECYSCRLTRHQPGEDDAERFGWLVDTTHAKRWLLFQLDELGLPITSHRDQPDGGLAFDLDASTDDRQVMIGHLNGVITIDLSESEDSHREALRVSLGEAYRTMLGHFRHEIGHYYWQVLVAASDTELEAFRTEFGDERVDYAQALDSHYGTGGRDDWGSEYISRYATTHPWEDFAETFAHYLHITDTLQSAAAFGLSMSGPGTRFPEASDLVSHPSLAPSDATMRGILADWQPLALALNQVNRSLGKRDLYPFVIPERVVGKLGFVHRLIGSAAHADARSANANDANGAGDAAGSAGAAGQ